MRQLVVLPVIDARVDKLEHVTMARNVRTAIARVLRNKGYDLDELSELRAPVARQGADLARLTAAELAELVPDDVGDFLLVTLDRVGLTAEDRGVTYELRLSGIIVDRRGPTVLWRDATTGEGNLTGVLTIFSGGSAQYAAAYNTARRLFASLPDAAP